MNRSWWTAKGWLSVGAATWLTGGTLFALPPALADQPVGAIDQTLPHLAIPDPFPTRAATSQQLPMPVPPITQVFPFATAEALSVARPHLTAASPRIVRLPQVSSFAPAPAATVPLDHLPPAPPLPPSAHGRPAPHRTAAAQPAAPEEPVVEAAPGSVDWRTVEIEPSAKRPPRPVIKVARSAPQLETIETAPPDNERPKVPEVAVDSTPPTISASVPAADPALPPTVERAVSSPLPSCVPTTTELTPRLLPAVQRGYGLAQRGALYAARAEFVLVLRRITEAKDAAANSNDYSQALAAGLRAIDEAEDFVPGGVRVEAELNVQVVASSHRTPVLGSGPSDASPQAAVAMYHRYAQDQLAAAVGGEQAGSMVLHGLGKVSATIARRGSGDPAMLRSAKTMYAAALVACPSNHLASNELGVLLVREGQADEAARLFERTIDMAASATAYHNLAIAQGKLGFHGEAAANEQESQRLAALERASGAVSKRAGVEWVSAAQMADVAQPGLVPTAAVPQRKRSTWQKVGDIARSLPLPGAAKSR